MHHTPTQLQEFYDALLEGDIVPRYNIAPASQVLALRDTPEGRVGSFMRWGLVPSWAKDLSSLPMLHNARGETVAEKPMFRTALRKRRCIVPASGFYEWKADNGSRVPHYIHRRDDELFGFAGLWEEWESPDGSPLRTCTIITVAPNELMAPIHNRMPAILRKADEDAWLNPEEKDTDTIIAMLKSYPSEEMEAYLVSRHVNTPQHDDASCIEPETATREQGSLF